MSVEMRGMRGGDFDGHVDELCHSGRYDAEHLRALGGVVDYTVKSRPGPGVFVLATIDDPRQRHMLDLYKLGAGPLYSFYTPCHLCHFEVPLSAARVALFRDAVLSAQRPGVDVITVAKQHLREGDTLDAIGGYKTYGQCEKHEVSRRENLLPLGLAEGCRLRRDVLRDAALTRDDVELPPGRLCDELRAEQDRMFPVA
jgi:predicted homoserine dehydrogenase-like protein